ncbi:TPA: hypothetical protein ACP6IR_002336 [Clostridioides difficile]
MEQQVCEIVLGDIKGIEKNTKKKKRLNLFLFASLIILLIFYELLEIHKTKN